MAVAPVSALSLAAAAGGGSLLLRQLFDVDTGTFTYLVVDVTSGKGLLIDPVFECFDRDVRLLKEMDLKLKYAIKYNLIKKMKFYS